MTPPAKLDRLPPTDFRHVERFPVTAEALATPSPVILAVNWYSAFDEPYLGHDERWWIGEGSLGHVRGGHCLAVKSKQPDQLGWYEFYDQGNEGACVGFGVSRGQTLRNHVRYDAFWLYHEAQKIDDWDGEDYDGTSLRAGLEVARQIGLKRAASGTVAENDGIRAYRWATSVDEVHAAIQLPLADQLGAVPLLNSWGVYYPHITWLPDSVLDRLLGEYGEAAIVTDR